MRNVETYFRKPVTFAQYSFLLVKTGRIWEYECGSWDETEMKLVERENIEALGKARVSLCTSPSDDETIVQRIIKEMNRFAR